MKNLVLLLAVMATIVIGCAPEVNPPFIVAEIGSPYFTFKGQIAYVSREGNIIIADSFLYEIGDTIFSYSMR